MDKADWEAANYRFTEGWHPEDCDWHEDCQCKSCEYNRASAALEKLLAEQERRLNELIASYVS